MLRDNLVGSSRRCCWGAEVHLSRSTQNSHRIGRPLCLENPRPAGAEYSLTESALSPFHAEPEQPKKNNQRRKKDTTLAINAGVAAVLDAITLPLVFTARSATVFLLPNRRAARPVASVKLRRNTLARFQRWDGHALLSRRLILPRCACADQRHEHPASFRSMT